MRGEPPPYVLLLILTAIGSLVATADVVRRRPARGVLPFAAMTLGTGWYALCYAVQLVSMTLPEKVFWARLGYLGVMAATAGLLGFANRYTERKDWVRWQTQILLVVEPVITVVLLWTNDAHHWVWTATWLQPYHGSFSMLEVAHGPWFWIHLAYSYGLILWSMVILYGAYVRGSHLHRRQAAILLVSIALPLVGYTLVLAGWNPIAPMDSTALWAGLAVIVAVWGLHRYRIFDLLPVARHAVVEQIEEGMVVVNAEGDIVDVNEAVLRLLGRNPAQVLGQPASLLLPFYEEVDRRHPGTPDVHEEIVWSAPGRRYFDLHRAALHDRHGRLGGYLFVLHDITVRREAEEQARQRSRELSMLYDSALEVVAQLDLPRLLQGITERAMQLLQASTGDLSLYRPDSDDLKATVLRGIGSELTGTVLKRGEGLSGKVLEAGVPLAVEDYRTWPGRAPAYDGLPFGPMVSAPLKWGGEVLGTIDVAREAGPAFTEAEVRLLSLFAAQAALAIANARLYADTQRELSERRLAEEQVQRRSQELSTLYDTVLEVASRLDLEQLLPTIVERAALLLGATGCGMYLYQPASDALEHVVAYGLSEPFIGHTLRRGEGISGKVLDSGQSMTVDDYHHWAGRSPLFERDEVGAVIAVPVKWGERVLGVIDLQRNRGLSFTAEDTRLLTLFANQAAIALANAQLYQAARRELAERKSAEAQLRESEQRYRAVVEDQTELVFRFARDEQVTFVNEAACRFLGKERGRIIGRSVLDHVPPEEQEKVRQALASITREVPVITMENRNIGGDGQTHWFQWTDRGIFDEQGTLIGYQSVGRDISDRRRAEETREALQAQLLQAQRMEAVGVLAGGVAHEFNNLLTVIQGNAELGLADLDANHPVRESLVTVQKTAQRAAVLTRQLLAFSRRQHLETRPVDVNAVISSAAKMLEPALAADVQLVVELDPGLKRVPADARAIEQVLMNLALNARDAMPEGGELRIRTAAVTLDDEFCRARGTAKPGEYVRLTVSDTGVGMTEEIRRHIFEPFFTTKEVGKGTGLGLSVVYGIVREHDGLIEVQSEVGRGARFDVYLPVLANQ